MRRGLRIASTALAAFTFATSVQAAPTDPPSAPSAPPASTEPTEPTAPTPAHHEPTAGDLATARTALREGLVLREKGDSAGALARLGSAYDLVQTPVTGFELGKTHLMLGHVLQASELFKKVVRMPPSMEESSRSQTARDEAARLSKEIEPRIPSVRLKLTLPPGANAVVHLDDELITTTSGADTVRAVDPGRHEVRAQAGDGPEEKIDVTVAEAETKDVALAPKWMPPKKPIAGAGANPIFVKQTNPLVFIGFGGAAVSALVTGITAVVSLDARRDARSHCSVLYCPPRVSTATTDGTQQADIPFDDASKKAIAYGAVAIIAGITTAVFIGVGLFGLRNPIKERVISGITILPGAGGASGTF